MMTIAIPTTQGKLANHFGHVQEFTFLKVDDEKIIGKEIAIPPAHEPGVLPHWLKSKNTDIVIAGGIGRRAQAYFEDFGIRVIYGAPSKEPEEVVKDYIKGTLEAGVNLCDH